MLIKKLGNLNVERDDIQGDGSLTDAEPWQQQLTTPEREAVRRVFPDPLGPPVEEMPEMPPVIDEEMRRLTRKPERRKKAGRKQSPLTSKYREAVLLNKHLKGRAYALAMKLLPTPHDWQTREGCPKTYIEAWDHRDKAKRDLFHKLISDQKYKLSKTRHK